MTEPDRDREHLIAFWRRLQKAALEMASRNVAITLRDAAWLYAKGYDIDAPIETMVNFIVYVDRLELKGGAAVDGKCQGIGTGPSVRFKRQVREPGPAQPSIPWRRPLAVSSAPAARSVGAVPPGRRRTRLLRCRGAAGRPTLPPIAFI